MVTEDYVSFETAKLMKEKGFDESCFCFYESDGKLYHDMVKYFPDGMNNSEHEREFGVGIAAPSLQMAAKWIRQEYKLHIYVDYECDRGYQPNILNIINDRPIPLGMYNGYTYERALEAAIVYSLENLI